VAQIAFSDDAAFRVVLRNAVRAIPSAVLAADAGFGAVENDTRNGILGISVDGTAFQTRRLQAVIATHGQMETLGIWIPAAFDFTDSAPVDLCGVAILFVACDNAAFATNTASHIEMKAILLAREKFA
jgi:hypothetical protein